MTRFNVDALAGIATRAVGAQRCVSFEKIADGRAHQPPCVLVAHGSAGICHSVFLRFNNESEAVARIPYSFVGNMHLVTASEVATTDFARTVLNVPVPRVLTWSFEPTEVGTDFSILEKPPGRELHHVWSQATPGAYHSLVHVSQQIHSMNQKFFDNPLSSYGSIFYRKDIKRLGLPHEPLLLDGKSGEHLEKFVIGPMVSWDFWRGERATMETDRGPCEPAVLPLHDLFSLGHQGRIRLRI